MKVLKLPYIPLSYILLIGILLSGCVSDNLGEPGSDYLTIRQGTPFYVMGPQQGRRADKYLDAQTRVTLLRKEMGYSLVQLEGEQSGYVANEDLIVAPPRPKPRFEEEAATTGSRGSRSNGTRYHGEQVNDTPLPNLPPPDLNIAPDDAFMADEPIVPAKEPSGIDAKPSFRY